MKRNDVIAWILIALFITLAIVCGSEAGQWKMDYSDGTKLKFPAGCEWSCNVPKCNGHVNMITRSPWWNGNPPKTLTAVVQLKQQNAHIRGLEHCDEVPPWTGMRFYLQRKGDDMTCSGDMASYRWWSNPVTFRLDPKQTGQVTVTVKINPNQWSNCWGKSGTQAAGLFWNAWKNPDRVGVTFGPSCRAGHGVCTDTGTALIRMIKFSGSTK